MNDNEILSTLGRYQSDIKKYTILKLVLSFVTPFLFFKSIFDYIVKDNWIICLVLAIVGLIVIKPIHNKLEDAKRDKRKYLGDNIIKNTIGDMISIQEYAHTKHIDRNTIKESPIMPDFDRINGSDYISGTYKNVKVVYSDVTLRKLETYIDNDGESRTTYEIKFRGHFLRLNLNSQIDGYVKLMEKDSTNKKGLFDNLIKSATSLVDKGENSIKVESEAFNNQFDIFTDNDELAFYILTPQFMESIVAADQYAGGTTNIYFNKTYVDIALDNRKDSFEVRGNIKNQDDLDKARANIKNDLTKVLSIVDQILEKDRLF